MKVPHYERFALAQFAWTPDPDAKLLYFRIKGGGGGGSGNQAANAISYDQYGFPGQPSGIGRISAAVSISGDTISWPGHKFLANDPIYFDAPPAPFVANQIYYVMADGSITPSSFRLSPTIYDTPLTTAVYAPRAQTAIVAYAPGSCTGNGYMWVAFGASGGGIVGDEANSGSYARADDPGPSGYVQSRGLQGGAGENLYADPGHGIQGGRGGGAGGTGGEAGINLRGGGGSGAYYVPGVSASGGSGAEGGDVEGWLVPDGNSIPILAGGGGAGGPGKNGGNNGAPGGHGVVEVTQFFDTSGVTDGTWVPTLIGSTAPGAPVYASQIGQWSRVGDLVTVWFRVQITTPDAVAAGTAVVAGLPFAPITAPGEGYIGTPGPMSYVSHTAGYNQFSAQIKDGTGVTFQEFGDNVIINNMPIGNVHANAIVGGSVTYRTSAP